MAIVEMKRAQLLALEKDKPAILKTLQKLSCFQITPLTEEENGFGSAASESELPALEDELTRLGWAIGRLSKFDHTKTPLLGGKPEVTADEAEQITARHAELMDTVSQLEELERQMGDTRGQCSRLAAQIEQLLPWQGLKQPVSDITATRNTVAVLGTMQNSALENGLPLPDMCVVTKVGAVRDQAYVTVMAHRSCWAEAQQVLKEANFAPAQLSQVEGTVSDKLAQLSQEQESLSKRQEALTQQFAAYVDQLTKMKIDFDLLSAKRARLVAAERFAESGSTFYLKGWVPAVRTEKVEAALRQVAPSVCLEFADPAEDEEPPVLLHNSRVIAPQETIVAGFSLPTYSGLDPTAVMTPFFLNFLGMMVSDAGYGLLMAILIPILIKLMKPSPGAKRLMWILTMGGIATVIWGFLYNTWFGAALLPKSMVVFDPVNNALPVMGVCIGIGAIHLFTGLGVAAYMNIKRGKPLDAVADQLSWLMLIIGLAMLILPATAAIGQWMAIAGVVIILCTAGREKSKNPFKRLVSGLGALYGITSWVSDLLSYMRLFGMGLATGVIGMVINQLVGMVFGAGPIGWVLGALLFCGGHLFNAGINILGAYVHSCRLQYIEFFGKFYEDGGKPFDPLTVNNRYVTIQGSTNSL